MCVRGVIMAIAPRFFVVLRRAIGAVVPVQSRFTGERCPFPGGRPYDEGEVADAEQELKAAYDQLRELDLDETQRARMMNALKSRYRQPKRTRPPMLAFFMIAVAVSLTILFTGKRTKQTEATAHVIFSERAQQAGEFLKDGSTLRAGAVSVAAEGQVELRFFGAKVGILGPASFDLTDDGGVSLLAGRASVVGELVVHGPRCVVSINGRAVLTKLANHLKVDVHGGEATPEGASEGCDIAAAQPPSAK